MSQPVSQEVRRDIPLALLTYGAAAVVFTPVLHWLTVTTRQSEQLIQAFAILAFASAFLIWEKRGRVGLYLRHDRASLLLLGVALLLAGLQVLNPTFPWILAALAFLVASLVRYILGPSQARRLSPALITALLGFIFFVVAMPWLDWPLRMLAGQWSARILELLGITASLHLVAQPEPGLILQAAGRPFLVAPECNGFGLLSSSLVLALILSVYRRLAAVDGVLVLVGALGFSIEEAAATCGCAMGTVKSRANRGRRALAEMLGLSHGEGMDLTENATMAVLSAQQGSHG